MWRVLCRVLLGITLVGGTVAMTGCATGPTIDWESRIGNYTYDEAVLEYGPPDKKETLSDGTIVAEWLVRKGHYHGHVTGFGGYTYSHRYPRLHSYHAVPTPDRYLRLKFGPDGKLQSHRRVSH